MGLNSFLHDYFLREVHHIAVRTSPSETFKKFCSFDISSISWIRNLFRLRTIFDRKKEEPFHLTLRDAYQKGGFILLEEIPGKELVVGAIGKFWRPAIAFKKVDACKYADFHREGFAKVAWSLRCEPRIGGGTLCSFELRVGANDAISAAKMRTYYSFIGPFSRRIRRTINRLFEKELDSVFADELTRTLPGDSIIENPSASMTDGITIEAPPEAIWPWLMQMGCLRGGWYSYDWLDNAGVQSSKQIVVDWQDLKEGDSLNWTPQADAGCFVMRVDPLKALVLGSCYDFEKHSSTVPNVDPLPSRYFRSTWTFCLEPQTAEVTRLIVRVRGDYVLPKALIPHLRQMIIRPIHTFMERKQLQNIKMRAENLTPIVQEKIQKEQAILNEKLIDIYEISD